MATRNLSQLKLGETAVISGFRDTHLALKLLEMGCLPGTEIRLTAIAPLGDPICLQVGGYTLSLRLDEAAVVDIHE
ncbi:FeoA family protein [Siphonobacter aquaeclarae]|uniref:Ferrous iron transport protein A n=1 Tax=Siphonobacter aquaeclarae TaxID=563176 RepID=A0A1G9XUT5_9BACT|nr:FeoA family protein [Siphonobacter aquaeclarae]MBO9640076.1 ferrous iron transport protein A [Siphonobacter aquaeclarae]SDN00534.1 ferrous iron transport protein A [Siphonobacter aquaeclarae]